MVRILVALGSNVGDVEPQIHAAWQAVVARLRLQRPALSPLVRSAPAEGVLGGDFANAVGSGETDLAPMAVLRALQEIEQASGRNRAREGAGRARTLDLDLLDWGGERMDTRTLSLPHPRLASRDFVLVPLQSVAPDFVDARTGRDLPAMLAALDTRWNLPVRGPLGD